MSPKSWPDVMNSTLTVIQHLKNLVQRYGSYFSEQDRVELNHTLRVLEDTVQNDLRALKTQADLGAPSLRNKRKKQ